MNWLITYTTDYNESQHTQAITAASYTQAYILFTFNNSIDAIILSIKKI